MDKPKKYAIYKNRGTVNFEKIEKTEEELTEQEIDFFLGQLVHFFNISPPKAQRKFITKLMERISIIP